MGATLVDWPLRTCKNSSDGFDDGDFGNEMVEQGSASSSTAHAMWNVLI